MARSCRNSKPHPASGELECRLFVDLDKRKARLTNNGKIQEIAFSESVTSVNYIGFRVQNADTLFTVPVVE